MELKINIIDAFTDVNFKGNSAAVIITKDWLSDELMQSIAIENNLSETAFVKKIDNEQLKKLAPYDVVVTAKSKEYDFVSRYFWPANGGGNEDAVTGSIHAGLAPYWSKKLNQPEMIAYQASKRGGKLMCRVEGGKVYTSFIK